MDGFSSFFALSKTEYEKKQTGTVLHLAITGYNKGSIDNLMTQKVIANTVHSVVGEVKSSTDVVTSISHLLAKHSSWKCMVVQLASVVLCHFAF
jgi:Na+-translocating ferredoxin:NAD+ oxidoreductase RnfD subunit